MGKYEIRFKPKVEKDCRKIPKPIVGTILDKIECLKDNLAGDVKKLTNFTPEYRLRCGNYRVLFEVDGQAIIVYRILHRKDAYLKI